MSIYNLADVGDEIDDLSAQRVEVIKQMEQVNYLISKYSRGWARDHNGGQSQDQYGALMNDLQGQLGQAQAKIGVIDQKTADVQAEQARKAAQAQAEAERRRQAKIETERKAAEDAKKAAEDAAKTQTGTTGVLTRPSPWERADAVPPPGRADAVQPPLPPPAPAPVYQSPTAAETAAQAQAGAESLRKAMFLVGQPGFDYGSGAQERNRFYGVGENMSGLGASFDFVGAVMGAAKDASRGIKGSEVLAEFGITPPKAPAISLPAPVKTFFDSLASRIKRQAKTPTPVVMESPLAQAAMTAPMGIDFKTWGLYGLGAFIVYKIARRITR